MRSYQTITIVILALFMYNCANSKKETTVKPQDKKQTITPTGLPELHQAIIDNDEIKVLTLIKAGADVNQLDSRMGNAPLHIAAQGDNPKMIEILLENGAFVNLHTPHAGHTPLMVAAWYSKPENIKALLKAPDINVYAKSPYRGSTARNFIGGFDKNRTSEENARYEALTAIFDAYEEQLKNKIEDQKVYQVVVDNKLSDSQKAEKIQELITQGINVNTEYFITGNGNDKHSPLLVASRNNYPEVAKVLLEAGADIGQRGYLMNAIAFHKAGYMGNTEIMEMLVNHKDAQKYINDQGLNNGYTPLHDAIWHGNTEAAKILIDADARLDLKTYEGDTPLDLAKRYNYNDIVDYIEKKNNLNQ
ncbi:ankyrin repeat domain-containing protein [Tenacibaculum amylolyticum]|uniref:ankyrin repeat domain-containing protein n=1 Tax=Tenacibaculum amylolyticum TaxID=104269 RepID=UPI0038B5F967